VVAAAVEASTAAVALTSQVEAFAVAVITEVVTIAAVSAEVWRLARSPARRLVQAIMAAVTAPAIMTIPTLTRMLLRMRVRLVMTDIVFSDIARTTLPLGPISVTTDSVILVRDAARSESSV
jgi:hypothetical protein